MRRVIKVLATGVGLSVQDQGRLGWRRFGVPPSGAMDRYAAVWANQLLGNAPHAPVLEIAMQGAKFRVLEDTWMALAGADNSAELQAWTAVPVQAGTELDFTRPKAGIWSYLAVPGGFEVDHYFKSASVDARNGIGKIIRVGAVLNAAAHKPAIADTGVSARSVRPDLQRDYSKPPVLQLLPGPQYATFSKSAKSQMVESAWTISAALDRTGFRLEGPELDVPQSIPSEPVLPGSFQVPGNGQPIVTLYDGPTVGGYPKIAVLREADLDWFVQCKPGMKVRFQWAD